MVAGLSGLGKTTMCTSLMESWQKEKPNKDPHHRSEIPTTTTHIDASRLFERYDEATNTILRVRIIDTPGFGNRINYWNSVKPLTSYIAKCRQLKFVHEMSPKVSVKDYVEQHNRNNYCYSGSDDTLVHVCLYLISPGRFLEIDKHFLWHVKREVTVVPIIAKADTLTDEEIAGYRAELVKIFRRERLEVYNFDKLPTRFGYYRGRRPGELLAIISRNGIYPWGNSSALNPNHSDLQLIRDLLLSEHTERFFELALLQYANYRLRRISRRRLQDGVKYAVLVGLGLVQFLGGGGSFHVPLFASKALRMVGLGRMVVIRRTNTKQSHQPTASNNNDYYYNDNDSVMAKDADGMDNEQRGDESKLPTRYQEPPQVGGGGRRGFLGLFGTPEYDSLRKPEV
jgi:septin family protein